MVKTILKILLVVVLMALAFAAGWICCLRVNAAVFAKEAIVSTLGADGYETVEKVADDLGIDITDNTEVQNLIDANKDNIDELQELVQQFDLGNISLEELEERAREIINVPAGG